MFLDAWDLMVAAEMDAFGEKSFFGGTGVDFDNNPAPEGEEPLGFAEDPVNIVRQESPPVLETPLAKKRSITTSDGNDSDEESLVVEEKPTKRRRLLRKRPPLPPPSASSEPSDSG